MCGRGVNPGRLPGGNGFEVVSKDVMPTGAQRCLQGAFLRVIHRAWWGGKQILVTNRTSSWKLPFSSF